VRDERRSLIRSPDGLDQFGTQHVLIALISHQESVISVCTSILPLSRRTVRFWFGGEVVYLHTLYMSYTDNNLVSLCNICIHVQKRRGTTEDSYFKATCNQ
jgi:hypothetical protein